MAARVRHKVLPMRGYRMAGAEVWEANVADAGEDIILSDGVREERVSKTMASRYVTSSGTVIYLVALDFPAVTKAEELATLEERICFDALNGSTQPAQEKLWGAYASLACLVVMIVVAIWLYGASSAANRAAASSAAIAAQMQHMVQVVDRLEKTQGVR